MQNVIQEFTIGFFDSSGVFSVYAKEDDTERFLKFHLIDDTQEYTDLLETKNLIAFVREELPSGGALPDIKIDSSYIDSENSSITVPITSDMVQEPGTAICDLLFMEKISDTEYRLLSSTRFKLIIAENVGTPRNGKTKEWFDNWTELYIALKTLENTLETEEEIRVANEETRVSNENTRISNENERITAENTRIANENIRKSAETTRISNENRRITAENTRIANENIRKSAETTRISNENRRISNETDRINAESVRIRNEEERIANEDARISAENERISAEEERVAAEIIRETRVQEQVDEAHAWANGLSSETSPTDAPSTTNNSMYYSNLSKSSMKLSHMWADGLSTEQDTPGSTNNSKYYAQQSKASAQDAQSTLDNTLSLLEVIVFSVDFQTGNLVYNTGEAYSFEINEQTGNLEWEVSA